MKSQNWLIRMRVCVLTLLIYVIIPNIPSVNSITPPGRYSHNANLINSKIYFLGGVDERDKLLDDFFFLDVSGGTNFDDFSFQNFLVDMENPGISWGTTVTAQESIIYLYGGLKTNSNGDWQLANHSYSIDVINSALWTEKEIPLDSGPKGRRSMTSIVDKAGIIYVFGGSNQTIDGETRGNYDTTMYKLNSVTGLWSQAPLRTLGIDNTTLPGFDYSATMLGDGKIIYIGGQLANGVYLDMNKVWSYNTLNDQWTLNQVGGEEISSRAAHSAVLALAILDTTTWTWSKPLITNPSMTRHAHTATLYKNYMIVAFGAHQQNLDSVIISNNFISILDTSNGTFKWVPSLYQSTGPNNSTSNNVTSASTNNSNERLGIIVGASAAGFVGFSILVASCVLLYRHLDQKRQLNKAMIEGHSGMTEVVRV
ncbi:1612_t:CDS:2 [Ambispora leptoticha]|uniref:1612_t:CDS:1 n=1 Tax=Ambispora leptoticha TaxID=144679 RepID=A0A9N9DR66_9GLOM|nr:1612_t:CDS:2 [Ambispora leptoticha]